MTVSYTSNNYKWSTKENYLFTSTFTSVGNIIS